MVENETQETNEEVTEAVETQSPATEKGIDDPPQASEEISQKETENKTQGDSDSDAQTDSTDSTQANTEQTSNDSSDQQETPAEEEEEISYHAVEKEGEITAIWEMQGPKHLRTISPRSAEGQKILNLFTSEIHETDSPPLAAEASSE